MIPDFNKHGTLPPGIHWATWDEFCFMFGWNRWRQGLLSGLKDALMELQSAGCQVVYVDGSFVTEKSNPSDFDACWDESGVDLTVLDPVFIDLKDLLTGRWNQKARFRGEFLPASAIADNHQTPYLRFFQKDSQTGREKGIVALNLGGLK